MSGPAPSEGSDGSDESNADPGDGGGAAFYTVSRSPLNWAYAVAEDGTPAYETRFEGGQRTAVQAGRRMRSGSRDRSRGDVWFLSRMGYRVRDPETDAVLAGSSTTCR
jgi:hypothetical protein